MGFVNGREEEGAKKKEVGLKKKKEDAKRTKKNRERASVRVSSQVGHT